MKGIKTRIIAIDYGQKRIGIAYSDETKLIAMPKEMILTERKLERTALKFAELIRAHEKELGYQVEEIVIGKPLLMSGKSGLMADEVKAFVELLSKEFTCPIIAWDERLSSVQAERALIEANLSRKQRTKHVDQVAAVIILQSYLDHKHIAKERQT
ncbi:Holliday junction resolvase RuvX [Estrella lausannensis]|uniref:Putative pre-16S rRNA nuclease n=1 Tax=Estrella lausannensis TaxID=483423 RepID=A0A0H5DNY7_9BACT|nr:Holliday junction resolvase RuvX [Estrella lausannensis]CRX38156.1 Putative Holliday junction resolvase [Estrella lausannensis]